MYMLRVSPQFYPSYIIAALQRLVIKKDKFGYMKLSKLIYTVLLALVVKFAAAQQVELQLARQYESNGDLQKAHDIYEKLFKQDNDIYYPFYINNLLALKKLDEAETITKKLLKKSPADINYSLKLGTIYTQQGNAEKANGIYAELIKKMPADGQAINLLAMQFYSANNMDWAIKTFEQGRQLLKDNMAFSRELITLYRYKRDKPAIIEEYLNFLPANPNYVSQAQSTLATVLDDAADIDMLRTALLKRLQKQPNETAYTNMLVWVFMQQKNYGQALNQALAMNRRTGAATDDVLELCRTLAESDAFDEAIRGYEYIIAKGETDPLFITAKIEVIDVRSQKITAGKFTAADLTMLEKDYTDLLNQFGYTRNTLFAIRKLATLQAFKLHKPQQAQALLEQTLKISGLTPVMMAQCKLDLGDVYLLNNRPWDATLIYSQVEKQKADSETEEEAKYRNAKLAYYTGDFDFAKSQLGVLKAATTKLIANDALNLQLLISDEAQADSTGGALKMYARADMHLFAGYPAKALATLDSIDTRYPGNTMADDILMAKARIWLEKSDYARAAELLITIIEKYSTSLWADDALFMLGDIYEKQLNDKEAAKTSYQKIITDYPSSLHINEARSRFRVLRGDAPGA